MRDATIFGHTGAIICDEKTLLNKGENYHKKRRNLIKPLFHAEELRGQSKDVFISMIGFASGHKHYYHYLIEDLALLNMMIIALSKSDFRDKHDIDTITILVRDDLSSFQKQAYAYLEKAYHFVKIKELKAMQFIHAPRLLYPSITQNIHTSYITQEHISLIHDAFSVNKNKTNKQQEGRYLISRNDCKNRKIENEDAVMDFLKPHGFVPLLPAELPLEKQIDIFANAEIIIATSGAALTNLVHCNENTTVIVFYSKTLSGSQFLWFGKALKIKNIKHINVDVPLGKRQSFSIPIQALEDSLKHHI